MPRPPEHPHMLRERGLRGVLSPSPAFGGTVAAAKGLLTRGTLPARLMVAGTLLLLGLPALTILVYVWGYPSTPAPRPVVIVADGLQLLIVINALIAVGQLVGAIGGNRGPTRAAQHAAAPLRRREPAGLRELSLRLAEMIWEQERTGRTGLGEALLTYVRDAVTAEVEHRRRAAALEQRLAELELRLTGRAGARAPDRDPG